MTSPRLFPTSEALFARAQTLLPGGVSSPVRAFKSVGGTPLFMQRGEGPYLFDVDGHRYTDLVLSFGPLIHGHAHPEIVAALQDTATRGTTFGAPTGGEIALAEAIQRFMPGMEKIRFVSSGTEATMSALRVARAATGRSLILKFDGHYHGHADGLLAKAGSGVATLGLPDSPGVPESVARHTLVIPFNDVQALTAAFAEHGTALAACIVEPVAGNMGLILPKPSFLETLRALTEASGALLIFDEVMTGFRVHPGGAQAAYGVAPDLTCLGKIIGGGLPVGAYGGRADLMALVAPEGPVYQAGTLSGNPLAMAAGLATLRLLETTDAHEKAAYAAMFFVERLTEIAHERSIPLTAQSAGSMFGFFFTDQPVWDYADARASNTAHFRAFHRACLQNGVYLPPSPFEACFTGSVHQGDVLSATADAFRSAMQALEV